MLRVQAGLGPLSSAASTGSLDCLPRGCAPPNLNLLKYSLTGVFVKVPLKVTPVDLPVVHFIVSTKSYALRVLLRSSSEEKRSSRIGHAVNGDSEEVTRVSSIHR